MAEAGPGELRYKAFLSYSHKDAAVAAKLHRRLETYRLPRRLVGKEGAHGPVPERLWPIFRDREELPAATDLSETVRAALAESRSLIVLCSPSAAASLWVAEEIETFRRLYPERPILAAIIDGEPGECFPTALRAFGQDGTWHEPLATDLRPQGDGPQLGLLKLVAGITGVGLDALVQRDAQRKVRRVTAVTAAALVALLMMTGLTAFALDARAEAERQRTEAEGLIEFMLTDLRERLRGVGRIRIMDDVNQRALQYYENQQQLGGLADDSLVRRARVLLAIGEDHLSRDNYSDALAAFREAHRTTAEQLARAPTDPERIFAHSQSEFYLGRSNYERRDFAGARNAWQSYKTLAERLIEIDPRNADWLKESAFANGSLCTLELEGDRNVGQALRSCMASLRQMESAARTSGNISEYRRDLANRHAYVGDALRAAGRPAEALVHQQRRLEYVDQQLTEDPENAQLRARRVWALRSIAHLEMELGRLATARRLMSEGLRQLRALAQNDPDNAEWQEELNEIDSELRGLE